MDKIPPWGWIILGITGGGTIGTGGTLGMIGKDTDTYNKIESIEQRLINMQETDKIILDTRPTKEHVDLTIKALCK